MKANKILLSLALLLPIFLLGCSSGKAGTTTTESKPPTAAEVLEQDQDADIFRWENTIYKTGVAWVDELKLTKQEEIGRISSVYKKNEKHEFQAGMATKLPNGTKLYSVKGHTDVLIAEVDGITKKYLALAEG